MTHNEFLGWVERYKAAPFDDLHRYHRPAALVSVSLGGGEVQQRLDWLAPSLIAPVVEDDEAVEPGQYSQADLNTFAALGQRPPTRSKQQ